MEWFDGEGDDVDIFDDNPITWTEPETTIKNPGVKKWLVENGYE